MITAGSEQEALPTIPVLHFFFWSFVFRSGSATLASTSTVPREAREVEEEAAAQILRPSRPTESNSSSKK